MPKLADPSLKLRCLHCLITETPLWRAGPDGPKTLCNACGVRYKKGKLVLYKNSAGDITAVKRDDAPPVHVPPFPKKGSKRAACTPSTSVLSCASSRPPPRLPSPDSSGRRVIKKVPSEGSLSSAAVAKRPWSRSRRNNAGMMPGRYATKTVPEGAYERASDSSTIAPSSASKEDKADGMSDRSHWVLGPVSGAHLPYWVHCLQTNLLTSFCPGGS